MEGRGERPGVVHPAWEGAMTKPGATIDTEAAPADWPRQVARAMVSPVVETATAQGYDERRTMQAWEVFVSSGRLDSDSTVVRAAIRHSWERSMTLGVDAQGRGSHRSTPADNMQQLQLDNEDILVSARAAFQHITDILSEAGSMAVVTDAKGVILDVGGNERTIDRGHEIRLEVGAAWGESVAGTNGIGTALATGQPVHVHAGEHFCQGVKHWACIGAPIHDPLDDSVIGLIDLSGPQGTFNRHSVALAMMSAAQIERALAERLAMDRIRLLEATLDRQHGPAPPDGMIVLDRLGRVLHFTESARRRWHDIGNLPNLKVSQRIACFDGRTRADDIASHLPVSLRGQSVEPLVIGGVLRGAMLVMKARPRPMPPAVMPASSPTIAAARARIVGASEALQQAVDRVIRASRGKTAILLEGETGVGKELFAQLAHAVGQTTGKEPFVALNCGAIARDLLGGELFGHAPGAFTGATREGRAGRFEHASGGTLSLDEIGEMPLDLQPYLLRALEERAVYRLGESKARPIDVRLVASTNRNLKQEVEEGRFRRDLYYRIGVVRITIPPLRQRSGDIAYLVDHFNTLLSTQYGREPLRFEPAVLAFLDLYDWPGNVRELRNVVEGLVLMSTGDTVTFADLPEEMTEPKHGGRGPLPPSAAHESSQQGPRLEDAERHAIEQAIADAHGNVSVAADRLGVARSTIYRKLQQYRSFGP